MSLINRMLQELDRRHAEPVADAITQQVEVVAAGRRRRDLFWLILGLELAVALGWLAWTSYQLRPQSVVTDLALRSAGGVTRTVQPARQQPAPVQEPAPVPAAKEPPPPMPAVDRPELAQSIERPKPAARRRPAPVAQAQPQVQKRPHARTPAQEAEAEFRRALRLLDQGRVSEAEQALRGALAIDPSQAAARQALISLLVDQRRLDEAQRLLKQALALDPTRVRFATVLARILVERDDYDGALEVLRGCKGDVSRDADFNALLGAVLQHTSRPGEAADAYRAALRVAPQAGTAWIGLGLSLEALDHRPEAAEAFRRAVATGSLGKEVRDYAEQQLRRLQQP
ncbi:MAG TPA: tetratricopeptide repeat protein [Burkholderiales bacterium]|nr:tetratricopeptide repeat protein [Burkholderiales bacterium]